MYIIKIIYLAFILFFIKCVVPEDIEKKDVEKVNSPPEILDYSPQAHVQVVQLSDGEPEKELVFSVSVIDPDGDVLRFRWEIMNCDNSVCKLYIPENNSENFRFLARLPQRDVFIGVEVSDGLQNVYNYWIVEIQKGIFPQ